MRDRARQLKEKWPGYGALLDFYVAVREAQQVSKPRVRVVIPESSGGGGAALSLPRIGERGFPVDIASSANTLIALCRLARTANKHLATEAEKIEQAVACGGLSPEALLADAQKTGTIERFAMDRQLDARVLAFLIDNSLRPSIEAARDQLGRGLEPESWRKCSCPVCGAPPAVSVLKGEPVLRYSVCSRCSHQWHIDRLSCAVCGERSPDVLQFFHEEGDTACRIDVCDSCHHYIKTIDVRPLEAPDPLLEDLATLHLDLLAVDKGYSRFVPNPWSA